ncbi:maleylpyruvate isomerase family mycothiol-dependent enzyme [Mycobacterium sp. 050128]|uniref:maleylpyruvate isomerase family mycothiol-dependent enzyme n=1 Tax=Mycobacterium sp. 050128 TaxID=3096112 RepID=UPI002ED7F75F
MIAVPADDYLGLIELESRRLIEIAAMASGDVGVPTCPEWTLRDLVGHVGGAHRWVSTCVTGGLEAQQRLLPLPPDDVNQLSGWFGESVDRLRAALSSVAADELVWTPLKGPQASRWWRRKAALEAAIHRWDADNATHPAPEPLAAALALDGIAEFTEEFLPLMVQAAPAAPVPSIRLCPNDIDICFDVPLMTSPDGAVPGRSGTELSGSASDLLLWIWNRIGADNVVVVGDAAILRWWPCLAI